jgi:hypothetical protein
MGSPEPLAGFRRMAIDLESLAIADGNWDQFAVPEARDLSLEFAGSGLATTQGHARTARAVAGYEM